MHSKRLVVALALLVGCSSSGAGGGKSGGTGGDEETGGTGGDTPSGGSGGKPSGGSGGSKPTGGTGGSVPTGGTGGAVITQPDAGASGGAGGDQAPDAGMTPRDSGMPDEGTITPPAGNPYVYVGTGFMGSSIRIFQLDLLTGALASKGTAMSDAAPTYMAFHPTRKFAYALSENDPGSIVAFSVNGATGGLTRLNAVPSAGDGPAHLSVHPGGKWIFVANYNNGVIAVLPVDPTTGRVSAAVDTMKPVPETSHNMRTDPEGRFVFLSTPGGDKIFQYKFDQATGKLSANSPASVPGMGQGPRHLDFRPDGKSAYAIGETGGGLMSFDYNAATGQLSNGMVATIGGGLGAHVQVHPSGKFVYACVRATSTLAGFTLDAAGRPKLIEKVTEGLASPWDFAIDAAGKYLLVANDGGGVRVFKIDEQTGKLTAAGAGVNGGGPHFVGVMYPP
jgi:6-phosphogluconolactonase